MRSFSGVFLLNMPSFYMYKKGNGSSIMFSFLKKFFYKSFIKHLFYLSNRLSIIYFVKLRIRGLGFRMRSINDVIFYFFFNYTNFIIYLVLVHY